MSEDNVMKHSSVIRQTRQGSDQQARRLLAQVPPGLCGPWIGPRSLRRSPAPEQTRAAGWDGGGSTVTADAMESPKAGVTRLIPETEVAALTRGGQGRGERHA